MAFASCWSFPFNSLNQNHHLYPCKYSSSTFSLFLIFSPPKHARELSPLFLARENVVSRVVVARLSTTEHDQTHINSLNSRTLRDNRVRFRSLRPRDDKVGKKYGTKHDNSVLEGKNDNYRNKNNVGNEKNVRKNQGVRQKREMGSRDKNSNGKIGNVRKNGKRVGEEKKMRKGSKKSKVDSPEVHLRVGLDTCSKIGDVKSAIELFDWAEKEGIKLGQYHYTVLLYLCSSAAVGVVRPAKSGTASRSLEGVDPSDEGLDVLDLGNGKFSSDRSVEFDEKERINWFCNGFVKRSYRLLDGLDRGNENDSLGIKNQEDQMIRVDEELKEYARKRGFEIFEKMQLGNIPMNEATLTSVARIAMSIGNGDMAFDMVKRMKSMGINPRLRSYGPALSAFCSVGDIDKAFSVEEHMLENGVYPEEPELQALLRLSVSVGKGDKVYYLLHKLRGSVRKVSVLTAGLIMDWFDSKAASRVGKTKWDKRSIQLAVANGGGGWHGMGWLGRGKWSVLQTTVGTDGKCQCCGEKLGIVDLDPKETEKFAESVASIAIEREKHSSFQKFQKWLEYYGPFEAVVDGANIGLFSHKRFMPSKINAVFNGIRQKLPSKKWPLIILHNRRFNGPKMDEMFNRALFDKWQNADAIYATPTGSNDDWYWLYAAIKFKCLLVTNDEMRDHTFQLLGNDFFPRWKERHQVRFTFSEAGPEFHMPPPYSVVIQESVEGHWHIPISSEHDYEAERPWLCIMRAKSRLSKQDLKPKSKGSVMGNGEGESRESEKIYKNLKDILSGSTPISDHQSILPKIETAELLGECKIDFQI